MKNLLLFIIALTFSVSVTLAQTAADFTATDCNSTSHTLYTELNSGKVIVFVWVMPCATCITGAKAAYDAVQSFASSHPGKVLYYMADDGMSTPSCSSLQSWASTNGISSPNAIFTNAGNVINETNYGGSGMPHIMVVAGTDHKIYFNELNGTGANTQTKIGEALAALNVAEAQKEPNKLSVFPNPAKNSISVAYNLDRPSDVTLNIVNAIGVKVRSITEWKPAGKHEVMIPFYNKLSNGIYFMQINSGNSSRIIKFVVAN
jgi:hypothetical protein